MPHFAANHSTMLEFHEQHYPESLPKHLSLQMESPLQLHQHLDFQQRDLNLSSTQSAEQSHQEGTGMQGAKSKDHCNSSESDGSYEKNVESQTKSVFFTAHPDFVTTPAQVNFCQSTDRIPFPYADPYGGGLFSAYGPPALIQPRMVGITPTRVVLPLDLAEDGPIYVNAKQYNGILRRRQMRAKLEAQNKLVKTRKPYLHESRHQHAINRVRGSGGRFLSMKKLQQPNPNSNLISKEFKFHGAPSSGTSSSKFVFSVSMQGSGRAMSDGTPNSAPVVR